ncbi:MBL fold metallo-hydrolase [Candidatus Woesearchaeota archaeon]|nr:MBL fold metallo-hydrolase [Candidatus Woesearchaeota archaeon]
MKMDSLFFMFEVSVLASGSSGNCFYIGSDQGDILIDAGLSCGQIEERLELIRKNINNISGIFITHEHIDHIRGIETLSHKYNIPIYLNKGTLINSFLDMGNINIIRTDQEIDFNGLKILPFAKSHDASEPVSFLIKNKNKKISIMTDIGFCCENVIENVRESDLIILESNHDLNMLKNGPYPYFLKKRIASQRGHISNYEAALLILEHANKKMQHVLLSHLSMNNNTPELALKTFNSIVNERSDLKKLKAWLTYRHRPTDLIKI